MGYSLIESKGEDVDVNKIKVISEPPKLSAAIRDEFEFLKVTEDKLPPDDPLKKANNACIGDQFANTIFNAPVSTSPFLTGISRKSYQPFGSTVGFEKLHCQATTL